MQTDPNWSNFFYNQDQQKVGQKNRLQVCFNAISGLLLAHHFVNLSTRFLAALISAFSELMKTTFVFLFLLRVES